MLSPKEYLLAVDETYAEVKSVVDRRIGAKDNDLLMHRVLGKLLVDMSHSPNDLRSNTLEWMVDQYVANKVGPMWPRHLALHQFLVKSGSTSSNPFDFEHCDRYGVAFADEEDWKSMALMTQNVTYMVVLQRYWRLDYDQQDKRIEDWITHIRVCTTGPHSLDFARPRFTELEFLRDHAKVYPEIGYGKQACDYFRYKDGRDRGYLCTVEPDLLRPVYETKDAIRGYGHLCYILIDMASHVDCLDE